MNITNSSTPISPCEKNYGPEFGTLRHVGLTKREHFAGLALQGIMANEFFDLRVVRDKPAKSIAMRALELADALLNEIEE